MAFDSVKNIAQELNPIDFASGLYESAVQQPLEAMRQLCGAHVEMPGHSNDTLAAKAGNLAGFIVDFTALSKLTGGPVGRLLGESSEGVFGSTARMAQASESVLGSMAKMSVAGGIYGGLLTPSSNDENIVVGRLENAAVDGATFATMAGISKALAGSKLLGENALISRVGNNAIAGAAGGAVNTFGSIGFVDHRAPTAMELASGVGQYAAFGAGFGALDYGIDKVTSHPKVQEKYYSLKWDLQDKQTEAKRQSYALLNRYDMRHPIQRLGDAITGSKSILDHAPRPALTAENNPVKQLEKELPEYFNSIDRSEEAIDAELDRKLSWNLREAQKETKAAFGEKLLQWWHGSADQPGIKSFSDAELATTEITAERVAAIRQALTMNGKEGKLGNALANLVGREATKYDAHDVADGIERAKERFYGYDEAAMAKKMAMPREHFYKDRDGLAPMSWMPFEPTDKLPNLFHGSVSSGLPGILTERGMLPSSELRLRGIGQVAGESADQEFPKRSISVTRDFNEAWAYHRHSPLTLDAHPVVYGISADVASKLRDAGLLEPGEQLIDRLRLGDSLMTKLGLRKPEITHIFVPDPEVSNVDRMLQAYRIKGVSVVGLSDLQTPQWKPVPELNTEEDVDNWMRSP